MKMHLVFGVVYKTFESTHTHGNTNCQKSQPGLRDPIHESIIDNSPDPFQVVHGDSLL